jgi:hypothetical protein
MQSLMQLQSSGLKHSRQELKNKRRVVKSDAGVGLEYLPGDIL